MEFWATDDPTTYENPLSVHLGEVIEEENDLDPDEGNKGVCLACTLPIFSTPHEKNEMGDFFHKCCHQLPQTLTQHPLHAKRPLHLHKEFPRDDNDAVVCDNCKTKCTGYFYRCPLPRCGFTLDILCATVVKLLHRSHKHELVPFRSKSPFTCGACKSNDSRESYYCNLCDHSIHRDCALLPNAIQHENHGDPNDAQPRHLLCLVYTLSQLEKCVKLHNLKSCSICREEFLSNESMYVCTRCSYGAHIKCAVSDPSKFHTVPSQNAAGALLHLPPRDENENLMRWILEDKDGNNNCETTGAKTLHDHDLILHTKHDADQYSSCLCAVCARPVSTPFYTYPRYTDFYLHDFCANLPLKARHPPHGKCNQEELTIFPRSSCEFGFQFSCCGCLTVMGNGISYNCKSNGNIQLHPQCALLPEVITHEAHGKSHILFLSSDFSCDNSSTCNCCGLVLFGYYYECCSCPNFKLHMGCALLPMCVTYKLDRHQLKLSFLTREDGNNSDNDFCEVCENPKNTKIWCYGCEECNTLFHVECIPSIGYMHKFIYGGSFRNKAHGCPLRLIPMLTSYSFTCNHCDRTIQGKSWDEFAFECRKCNYWLCSRCCFRRF